MRARTDRLAGDPLSALAHELAQLRHDVEEFTTRQPTSGQSGVLGYTVENPVEFDLIETAGSDDPEDGALVTVTVTFTGNETQRFPIENVFATIYFNGTDPENQLVLEPSGLYGWEDNDGRYAIVDVPFWGVPDPGLFTDPYELAWQFSFFVFKEVTYRFKAVVAGTSPGTIDVTEEVE
jgi:hypothetical protein